jgi:hypothetical protein
MKNAQNCTGFYFPSPLCFISDKFDMQRRFSVRDRIIRHLDSVCKAPFARRQLFKHAEGGGGGRVCRWRLAVAGKQFGRHRRVEQYCLDV